MPLTPDEQAIADRLADLYTASQARILAGIVDAATSPQARARLRALRRDLAREQARLDLAVSRWITADLPGVYAAGAGHAARQLGGVFRWDQHHREAVQALAGRTWDDVARSLQGVGESTRRAIRGLLDDQVRAQILEGVTGGRSSRDLGVLLQRETGAATVRYSNGARHSMVDYGDTLARTAVATTRNAGEFAQSRAEGVRYMECFDGPDCSLGPGHDHGPLADGLVLPIDEAESLTISHPRCVRSWSPRPDITTAEEAESGGRWSDEERAQRADEERARAATGRLVDGRPAGTFAADRPPRTPREPRQPREPRTPRTPRA